MENDTGIVCYIDGVVSPCSELQTIALEGTCPPCECDEAELSGPDAAIWVALILAAIFMFWFMHQ